MMCVDTRQMSGMTHQPMFSNPAYYYCTDFLWDVDGGGFCLFISLNFRSNFWISAGVIAITCKGYLQLS